MFIHTNKFIRRIRAGKGKGVLCGASVRTGHLIDIYDLSKHIAFVFDNYSTAARFHSIPIVNSIEKQDLKSLIFFVCGNHCRAFYDQLRSLGCRNIYIELVPGMRFDFFPPSMALHIETPDYQANHGRESCHTVVAKFVDVLLNYNLPIQITPTRHSNEYYFRERELKGDVLLFSYHSYGEKDFRKIHYKEGYFHDLINIDEMGYSGWSSLCHDASELDQIKEIDHRTAQRDFIKYKAKYIDRNLSKYKQPQMSNVEFPKSYVFIPLQVMDDSVMELSYFAPLDWLRTIVGILTENKIQIVIKRHPRCYSDEVASELDRLGQQENVTIYSGSIHQALRGCSAVYTINSGVGFEALFHLKPVVTFGAVDYESATLNIKDFKGLEDNPIPTLSTEKIAYIKQFLSYYMREKNINIKSKKSIERFVDGFVIKYLNVLIMDGKI